MRQVRDEWACALEEAYGAQEDVVPKGFVTMREYATKTGVHLRTANDRMRAMIGAGTAEMRAFRIRVGQQLRPVPHYRALVKK